MLSPTKIEVLPESRKTVDALMSNTSVSAASKSNLELTCASSADTSQAQMLYSHLSLTSPHLSSSAIGTNAAATSSFGKLCIAFGKSLCSDLVLWHTTFALFAGGSRLLIAFTRYYFLVSCYRRYGAEQTAFRYDFTNSSRC